MADSGDFLRHFSVVVNEGSGCIFQTKSDSYTYVLTVKHNLIHSETSQAEAKEQIRVARNYHDFEAGKFLKVRNCYIHPDKDYAIVEVDKIGNATAFDLKIGKYEKDAKVTISGFPTYQRNNDHPGTEHRTSLDAVVDEVRSARHEYDLTLTSSPETIDSGAAENITGFSGSGIFTEQRDRLFLCGIFPKLNDARATHGKIVGYDLSGYKEILNQVGRNKTEEVRLLDYQPGIIEKIKEFVWRFRYYAAILLVSILAYYIYQRIQNQPACENFSVQSDLNVLINGDRSTNKNVNIEMDQLLSQNLVPFKFVNKFVEGNTSNLASGEIFELSSACGADVLVRGTSKEASFLFIDDAINLYFQNKFRLVSGEYLQVPNDIAKMSMLIKCYLYEKSDKAFVKDNFKPENYITKIGEHPDTLDQMILQAAAVIAEGVGKKDTALILYKKIPEGGMNPEQVFKRQEVLAEELNKPHDAIIAQSGLIKIARQKNDTISEEKLLEKRARNYEKTGEKANELQDYKKLKQLNPNNLRTTQKIQTLEGTVNALSPSVTAQLSPNALVNVTNSLVKNNQFELADQIIKNHPAIIENNPKAALIKTEIDYHLKRITVDQIPDSVKLKNERLASKILVDKIMMSRKKLVNR